MRTVSAFFRVLVAVGMRLGVVVVPVARILMMPERHALTACDGCHALKRHDERNHDSEQTDDLQRHGGILLHG